MVAEEIEGRNTVATVNGVRVNSWRDCIMVSLLSDEFFPRGEGGEVDGLAYPLHRPTCKVPSCLVTVIVDSVCRGKGSFPGCRYLMESLSS
jgi:hypothetical protein